ncbi:MAG: hypothetical protein AAF380_00635, partial [Bacteroidota bacterium]
MKKIQFHLFITTSLILLSVFSLKPCRAADNDELKRVEKLIEQNEKRREKERAENNTAQKAFFELINCIGDNDKNTFNKKIGELTDSQKTNLLGQIKLLVTSGLGCSISSDYEKASKTQSKLVNLITEAEDLTFAKFQKFIKNIDFAFLLDIHRLQLPENDPLTLLFTAYPKYLTAKQKTVIINAV